MLRGDTDAVHAEQDRALRQLGLYAVRDPSPKPQLWAEHWPAVQLFDATLTQWTVGPSGRRVGLRNESVAATMDLMDAFADMPAERRREVFADLQVMELIALEHWQTLNPEPSR